MYRRFHEVVEQRLGPGEYLIKLEERPEALGGFRRMSDNSGLGRYRQHLTLRHYPSSTLRGVRPRPGLGITSQEGGLLSTGAGVGTSVGLASTIGVWAGPVGAAAGAIVGIIAGLWQAHDARVKGAKTENAIVGSAVQAWDAGMQAIFQAANAGQISGTDAAQLVSQLLSSYWQAVAQTRGMPGVADNSNGGASCGSYTPGSTTRCSPGHPCTKSCTAGCCVGCNDLWPSSLDAIAALTNPAGGSFTTCTVYSSSFGLSQRPGYTLTYTPPAPTPGNVATEAGSTIASALGLSPTTTVDGISIGMLLALGLGGLLLYKFL